MESLTRGLDFYYQCTALGISSGPVRPSNLNCVIVSTKALYRLSSGSPVKVFPVAERSRYSELDECSC